MNKTVNSAISTPQPRWNIDIQVLRGISVVLVVLFHAFPTQLPFGYLGVDIFFVISGYVISALLMRKEPSARALGDFYVRRAWRLLPSAYVVFFVTTILAGFVLASNEFVSFWQQLIGALSFTANMVLWSQLGYFDVHSTLKPLLHTWSLSVEEQFYLLWPALFLTGLRRWRIALVVAGTVGSLMLYLLIFKSHPDAAFYLLPTRGWQLGLGGIVYFLSTNPRITQIVSSIRYQKFIWSVLFVALIVLVSPLSVVPETYVVLAITFYAVILVLISNPERPSLFLIHRPMAYIGNISYVLYLVHWPLFSLARNVMVRGLSPVLASALVVISFALAALLHHGVENKTRHLKAGAARTVILFLLGASVILTTAMAFKHERDFAKYSVIRADNYGLSEDCNYKQTFQVKNSCVRKGSGKRVLVWGDSFAMHLVPGIVKTSNWTVIQATQGICSPFATIAPIYPAGGASQRLWSENCLRFNESVMQYIRKHPPDIVIMSSPFSRVIDYPGFHVLEQSGRVVDASVDLAVKTMQLTMSEIRQAGAKPVLVSPTPVVGFDVALCVERKRTGLLQIGTTKDCSMDMTEVKQRGAGRIAFVDELAKTEPVINLLNDLCDSQHCPAVNDGVIMFRDFGHLSVEGSKKLFETHPIVPEIEQIAR